MKNCVFGRFIFQTYKDKWMDRQICKYIEQRLEEMSSKWRQLASGHFSPQNGNYVTPYKGSQFAKYT